MPRTSGRVMRHRRPGPYGPGKSLDFTTSSILACLESLDSAVSLGIAIQLRYGDWDSIVRREINPLDYSGPDHFRVDYLAVSLLSKVDFISIPGVDKKAVALAKWRECEELCAVTNRRLQRHGSMPELVWLALRKARRKICRLLGDFSWDDAMVHAGFGRGGTTRIPRREACVANKVWGELHASSLNLVSASDCFEEVFALNKRIFDCSDKESGPSIGVVPVRWNKVTTVPKSAKTDRPIASEPDLNIWMQKGIGGLIRQRLKRIGIDLDDQTNNQRLAAVGSRDGSLATIDLSSASDLVSIGIVEWLLPDDWLQPLAQTRSTHARLPDGTEHLYRKWSSMGNGNTFELETLIFWGLTSAVCELVDAPLHHGVIVYGDDIIAPSVAYDSIVEVFTYCGFVINPKKSFATGPFRESCGKHYFEGEDVTPFYLRKRLDGPHRWFWWVNRIRYWARREVAGFYYCDSRWRRFYESQRRLFGALKGDDGRLLSSFTVPCGFGEDSGFVSNWDESRSWFRRERRNPKQKVLQVLEFEMLCHVRKLRTADLPGSLAAWLLQAGKPADLLANPDQSECYHDAPAHDEDEVPQQLRVNDLPTDHWSYSRKRGGVWQWYDIGPWI